MDHSTLPLQEVTPTPCNACSRLGTVVDSLDNGGRTALTYAAICGHTDVIRLLLRNGAVASESILAVARQLGHTDAVEARSPARAEPAACMTAKMNRLSPLCEAVGRLRVRNVLIH